LGKKNAMEKQLMGHMYKTMKEDKKIKMDEKGNLYSRLIKKSFFTENCFLTQFTWKTDPNGTKSKKGSIEDKQIKSYTTNRVLIVPDKINIESTSAILE
jgi:hypothetical protein